MVTTEYVMHRGVQLDNPGPAVTLRSRNPWDVLLETTGWTPGQNCTTCQHRPQIERIIRAFGLRIPGCSEWPHWPACGSWQHRRGAATARRADE